MNYVVFLGWNPKSEQEIFSKKELIENFDLSKVNKAAPIFSYEKLDWFNQQYIKRLSTDNLTIKCFPFIERYVNKLDESKIKNQKSKILEENYIKKIVSVERDRIKKLSDITENIDFFLFDDLDYPTEKLVWKKSDKNDAVKNLEIVKNVLFSISEEEWTIENIEAKIMPEAEKAGKGNMLWPMRYALTGAEKSPSPIEVAWVLGKSESIKRIENGVKLLGNIIKETKRN